MIPFAIFLLFLAVLWLLFRLAITLGLFIFVLFLVFLFSMGREAHADALEDCQAYGRITESIAQDKANGVSFEDEQTMLRKSAASAGAMRFRIEQVYLMTAIDLYKRQHATSDPKWLGYDRFNQCMRSAEHGGY